MVGAEPVRRDRCILPTLIPHTHFHFHENYSSTSVYLSHRSSHLLPTHQPRILRLHSYQSSNPPTPLLMSNHATRLLVNRHIVQLNSLIVESLGSALTNLHVIQPPYDLHTDLTTSHLVNFDCIPLAATVPADSTPFSLVSGGL